MREVDFRVHWSGAILLTVGLSMLLLVGEWFAALDACVANPACVPPASVSTLAAYLSLQIVALVLVVVGGVVAAVSFARSIRT